LGEARTPVPVKLVVGMLSASQDRFRLAEKALQGTYGPVDYRSPLIPFTWTDYYAPELGPKVLRAFVAFRGLIDPVRLAAVKLLTNDCERSWAIGGRRVINLDPGYLCAGKLVLATTKDHAHRVYLSDGVYAEVTLAWQRGAWHPWPWTYPDYRSPEYAQVFSAVRALYMAQLRSMSAEARGATPQSG